MEEINLNDLSRVLGGKNSMIVSEESVKSEELGTCEKIVTYRCPNCGRTYKNSYVGRYATAKGYPATTCPNCKKTYWGGEEVVKN